MARRNEMRYIQYNLGSAAPKLFPQPKKKKTTLPSVQKKQSYTFYVDPLAVGGILVSVVMLVLMMVGFAQLHSAKQELALMTKSVNVLHEENAELQEKYEKQCDLETVEKAALGLGMIQKSEAQHITISVAHQEAQSLSFWSRIGVFLQGLMA